MKTAFITCSDNKFLPGLKKLDDSICKHNNLKGIDKVLISDEIQEFRDYKIFTPRKEIYDIPIKNERFRKAYHKLTIFSMTEYEKIIYIDADILCLGDISTLFALKRDRHNLNIIHTGQKRGDLKNEPHL